MLLLTVWHTRSSCANNLGLCKDIVSATEFYGGTGEKPACAFSYAGFGDRRAIGDFLAGRGVGSARYCLLAFARVLGRHFIVGFNVHTVDYVVHVPIVIERRLEASPLGTQQPAETFLR